MPLTYTPQPDFDVNDGGTIQLSNSAEYRSSKIRIRDSSLYGWFHPSTITSPRTTFQHLEGSEVGSYQLYDRCIFWYDGGVIHEGIELFSDLVTGASRLIVSTSGGSDWTLDGSPIAGYFPTNLANGLQLGRVYTLSGTMETVPIVRTLEFRIYSSNVNVNVWVV